MTFLLYFTVYNGIQNFQAFSAIKRLDVLFLDFFQDHDIGELAIRKRLACQGLKFSPVCRLIPQGSGAK